ncbi:MAG TPA: SH3 domain-containing protein [Myxococcaceae bacterium]|nr:SH3 domain-containing protein [Myxococcaceae bacterium]
MKTHPFHSFRFAALAAVVLSACGPQTLEEDLDSPGEAAVESGTDALISGASRGSTVRANANVNLRTGASSTFGVILVVPAGATATVLNPTPSNGYYQVDYRGNVGWSHGQYWDVVPGLVVNGFTLNAAQDKWVRWIAANTVSRLQGTRSERLVKASRVAWWSLKEGVLDLSNPHAYSNCHFSTGDQRIGPLQTCPSGAPWQVGISGIQVPNYSLSTAESTALAMYPGLTVRDVLARSATIANYPVGSTEYNGIVNSTGDLKKSWLLRNHAVGITLQEPAVTRECITNSLSWCYNPNWYPSNRFSPNKTAALRAIGELQAILDGLAP